MSHRAGSLDTDKSHRSFLRYMDGKPASGMSNLPEAHHIMKPERDIEKIYSNEEFVAKLRRLADCIESGEQFEIQIAGERIYTPVRAIYSIEHEREGGSQEIEFQIRWDE